MTRKRPLLWFARAAGVCLVRPLLRKFTCIPLPFYIRQTAFLSPTGNLLPVVAITIYVSDSPLFPVAGKVGKRAARNQWFLDFLYSQEFRSLWDVVGIDSATDPLPLPLRRRKYYVYRRGIRIPTTSLQTVYTVVLAGFQPRCGMKTGTLS